MPFFFLIFMKSYVGSRNFANFAKMKLKIIQNIKYIRILVFCRCFADILVFLPSAKSKKLKYFDSKICSQAQARRCPRRRAAGGRQRKGAARRPARRGCLGCLSGAPRTRRRGRSYFKLLTYLPTYQPLYSSECLQNTADVLTFF